MNETAPVISDFQKQRDVGVAWMNRGHEQLLAGDANGLASALLAYEQAISILRTLPLEENPSWASSLGAALMNHGQLLHRVHGISRADEVLASFEAAIGVLGPPSSDKNPWVRRNLAGTHLNRACLLLDLRRHQDAFHSASFALTLAAQSETEEIVDADLALKTRRAICDAIGHLIVAPGAAQDVLASQASDLVDDGLALTRLWAARGETRLRPLALRFFRYGTQLYRLHQPHFLSEFIQENLVDTDGEFREIALKTIDDALAGQNRTILTIGDAVTERRLQIWRELEELRLRLVA